MAAKKQLMKPATQKVVKDAKPTEVEPRVISDEEYRCTCCGHKYKNRRLILAVQSPLFIRVTTALSLSVRTALQSFTNST